MKTLLGQAYSPNVTRLDQAFGGGPRDPATGSEGLALGTRGRERTGPMKTASIPFRLTPAVALNLMTDNPHRKGLVIQNLDPVTNLNVAFGTIADANSFALPPNSVMLLDFVCPTDSVWLFATLAVSGFAFEFARQGQASDAFSEFERGSGPGSQARDTPLAALPSVVYVPQPAAPAPMRILGQSRRG